MSREDLMCYIKALVAIGYQQGEVDRGLPNVTQGMLDHDRSLAETELDSALDLYVDTECEARRQREEYRERTEIGRAHV